MRKKNYKNLKKTFHIVIRSVLEVHLNLIKTYKYTFTQVQNIIKKINNLKIKYLYIVDSSGGNENIRINKLY